MINVNAPVEVQNLETMLKHLESEQEGPYHNSFLDLDEPQILSDAEFNRVQFKKYSYAVEKVHDSKIYDS